MRKNLRVIFWELTARCNLQCRHCRAAAQGAAAPDELPTPEIVRLMRGMAQEADPVIVLTGGEPLAHPDFFEIARACTQAFTRVALATNGTLVTGELAEHISDSGIRRASVSLDGARARTHDEFRGVPGSFDAAVQGMAALHRAGIAVQVNVTATRHNFCEMEKLLALARSLGADAFHLFLLVPVGCGVEIPATERLLPAENEDLLKWLYLRSLELQGQMHLKATCAPQYFRIRHELSQKYGVTLPHTGSGVHAMTRGCLAGSDVCFIARNGDVQPCGYLPLVAGNVRTQSLAEIWTHAPVFAALRDPDRLGGKCGRCEYRVLCQGCRARAYAATGDYLAAEPDCPYQPVQAGVEPDR